MLKLTSKQTVAIGITPRVNDAYRDLIEERLNGINPMSPVRQTYDTGTKRKTILDQSGFGPNEIPREQGDKSSMDNVSSGYTVGSDTDRPADDETGPGFTRSVPETDVKHLHRQFMSQDEIGNFLFRNEDSDKRDQKSRANLFNVYQGQHYGPTPKSTRWHVEY